MRMCLRRCCRVFAMGATVVMIAGLISPSGTAGAASPSFTWGGLYGGVHIGYGWGNADTELTPLPTAAVFVNLAPQTQSPDPDGVIGGLQAGYNWQWGAIVLGAETDFSWSAMSGTKQTSPIIQNNGTPFPGAGYINVHQDTDWFGTLRVRVGGTPIPRLLLYGTGGLAYGRVNYSANTNFLPPGSEQYPVSFGKTKVGWTAGAGVEYALGSRWSVKAEYLYYDLGSETAIANASPALPPFQIGYEWDTAAHIVSIGLNYRFW